MGRAGAVELPSEDHDYYGEDAATLGDRIAAARNAAGLTQSGLAERLGVGAKVVSAWENDRSEPRANRLAMLCGLLGVNVKWLLTGAGDGVTPPGEAHAPEVGPRKVDIVRRVAELDEMRAFYVDSMGCTEIEAQEDYRVYELFGHHVIAERDADAPDATIASDASELRLRISWEEWRVLVERLRAANVEFVEGPAILNVGAPNEEGALSVHDPSGALIGFRAES